MRKHTARDIGAGYGGKMPKIYVADFLKSEQ